MSNFLEMAPEWLSEKKFQTQFTIYEHIPHPGKQGHDYLIDLKFGKVITGIRLLRKQNFRKLAVLSSGM